MHIFTNKNCLLLKLTVTINYFHFIDHNNILHILRFKRKSSLLKKLRNYRYKS